MTTPKLRLEEVRRRYWQMNGRLEALGKRRDELTVAVGAAKARLELREAVDAQLDELQELANGRVVADYTKLLTALVQDVMTPEDAVELELSSERGGAALDIFHRTATGRTDVYRGAGGSITNVVCLGLRAIATAKAGGRRFMALDEPDCWIKPPSVPKFYRVVKRLADQGGFQTLVISHHDISLFDQGVNVIKLTGTPQTGLVVNARSGSQNWTDDVTPGLRGIRLQNFAGYIDVTIPLAPGVNAIIGEHNIGKSHVLQLLRAIAYGGRDDCSNDDIRHGERSYTGTLYLEQGRELRFTRDPRKTPVNHWRLTDREGKVVELADGTVCDSGKRRTDSIRGDESRALPEWVPGVLGISRRDNLDIQLQGQKQPVFLLDLPATQRAAVLSIGQESGTLAKMLTQHRKMVREDTATVRVGEGEMNALLGELAVIERILPSVGRKLESCDEKAVTIEGFQRDVAELSRVMGTLRTRRNELAARQKVAAVLARLPAPPDLTDTLRQVDELGRLGSRLTQLRARRAALGRVADVLARLPSPPNLPVTELGELDAVLSRLRTRRAAHATALRRRDILARLPSPPVLPDIAPLDHIIGRLARQRAELAAARDTLTQSQREENEVKAEMTQCLASIGFTCPMCGQGVDHEHMLAGERT